MRGAEFLDAVRAPLAGLLFEYATTLSLGAREDLVSQNDIRRIMNICLNGLQDKISSDSPEKPMLVHQRRLLAALLEMMNTSFHDHDKDTNTLARGFAGILGVFLLSVNHMNNRSAEKISTLIDKLFDLKPPSQIAVEHHDPGLQLMKIRADIETAVYTAGKEMIEAQHALQLAYLDKLISDKPANLSDLSKWVRNLPSYRSTSHSKWIDRQIERWGSDILAAINPRTISKTRR